MSEKTLKLVIGGILSVIIIVGGGYSYYKYTHNNSTDKQNNVTLQNDENKQDDVYVKKDEDNSSKKNDNVTKKIPYDEAKANAGDGDALFDKLKNSVSLPEVKVDSETEKVAIEQTLTNADNFGEFTKEYYKNLTGVNGVMATGGTETETLESFSNKGFYSSPAKLRDWLKYYRMGWKLDKNGFYVTKYDVDGIVEELVSFVDENGQKTAISKILYRPIVGATEVRENYLTAHGKDLIAAKDKQLQSEYAKQSQTPSN